MLGKDGGSDDDATLTYLLLHASHTSVVKGMRPLIVWAHYTVGGEPRLKFEMM